MIRCKSQGFTLIEVIVAIAVIAVLSAVIVVALNPAYRLGQSHDAVRKATISGLASAITDYKVVQGAYPPVPTGSPPDGWFTSLKSTSEISSVPQNPNSSASSCTTNQVNGWCYNTNGTAAIAFTQLEVSSSLCSDPSNPIAYYLWSSADNQAGIVCLSADPTVFSGFTYVSQGSGGGRTYPSHSIISAVFWIGEIFDPTRSDGSQVCSTYDHNWAYDYEGVNTGSNPPTSLACPGSITGSCDGSPGFDPNQSQTVSCYTESRSASKNYFPPWYPSQHTPKDNPFYLDLPFDDVNDSTAFNQRCTVIPWANDFGYKGHCSDPNFSYMKNRWVAITGPTGQTCYGQNEDAGPGQYHDANYVFGSNDPRPVNTLYNGAGMDVSPALRDCLGFTGVDPSDQLNNLTNHVTWKFVDDSNVPSGPWKQVISSSQVH